MLNKNVCLLYGLYKIDDTHTLLLLNYFSFAREILSSFSSFHCFGLII